MSSEKKPAGRKPGRPPNSETPIAKQVLQMAYRKRLREHGLVQISLIVPAVDKDAAQEWARLKRDERGMLLPREKN